ncbi:hypothetical protein PVL29_002600 [Vitis rotundifolia]|uniref:Peptidase A1 domain-containing protein n=1 Tax=Vitis rotundifolia TaxID=103349 RepID=A0AA39AID8_VITRO|nr:hypothetical protein PVL29_002600 [Vitis rotundifolia]
MEGFSLKFLFYSLAVIFFIHFSRLSHTEASSKGGFSTDLISRDSPLSPFYNPSETQFDRLQKAFSRSISRANHFRANGVSTNNIQSPVISNSGEYLMNISLGTPPVSMHGIADTGSDLVWRQCEPCDSCYEQIEPIFDPAKSKTYQILSCEAKSCSNLGGQGGCGDENTCVYSYSYGDGSHTSGDVAVDTLTIGSTTGRPVSVPKLVFGCGHNNGGTFNDRGSGLVGLGGGPLSMISQLRPLIGGRFSYCLVPFGTDPSVSSKMHFGSRGIVSGPGAVSTPLASREPNTFYYLTLESISVGSKKLAYKGFSKVGSPLADADEGNIIIDSGTTLTLLPRDFYATLESNVARAIGGTPVSDPNNIFSLCYSSLSGLDIPTITAHFVGADVELKPLNTFVQVQEGLFCFTMIPASDLAIFGNLAQMNFLVGYDLKSRTVSFKPTDCTKAN